jgi:hypothetical protein
MQTVSEKLSAPNPRLTSAVTRGDTPQRAIEFSFVPLLPESSCARGVLRPKVCSMIDLKHEAKICPRCAREFVCKANRIHRCDCMDVRLSLEAMEHIRQLYDDCLCVACLEALECVFGSRSEVPPKKP